MTDPHARCSADIRDEAVDRALARFTEAANSMIACKRCNGTGYHHGFGEHGHDPDWCEVCNGCQSVPEFDDREAMREALKAAMPVVAQCAGRLTFGAAVENIAASDRNPIKYGIFIRKTGRTMAEYATKEGCHSTPLDNLRAAQPAAAPVETKKFDAELVNYQCKRGDYCKCCAGKPLLCPNYEGPGALSHSSAGNADALRLLAAEDERQSKLHELLETIREQIRLEVAPEHRPEGLFKNIQDAVYAMRGRTRLMDDAAITHAIQSRIADGRTDSPSPAIASPVAPSRDEERGRTFNEPQAVEVTDAMIEAAARAVGYRDYIKGLHNSPEKAEEWSAGHYHMYRGIAETALRAALSLTRPQHSGGEA